MSIRASNMTWNEYGDPKVTITIEGHSDMYRFAHNMQRLQSDHAAIGFSLMAKMKRKWGAAKFARLDRHMHGGMPQGCAIPDPNPQPEVDPCKHTDAVWLDTHNAYWCRDCKTLIETP